MTQTFTYVKAEEINQTHLDLMDQALVTSYDNASPAFVTEEIISKRALLYEYKGEEGEYGIYLFQPSDGDLFVWLMSGQGLYNNMAWISPRITAIAEAFNCTTITSCVVPWIAPILIDKEGFVEHSIVIRKELNHGRR